VSKLTKRGLLTRYAPGAVVRLRDYPDEVGTVRECDEHGPTVLTHDGYVAAWCFADIEESGATVAMGEE